MNPLGPGRIVRCSSPTETIPANRFVKKHWMKSTPRGSHIVLQIRANCLNGDLPRAFRRWYLGLGGPTEAKLVP